MAGSRKKLSPQVQPSDCNGYGQYLQAVYDELKNADPKYSYKLFAEALGIGAASNLHNLVKGKRKLSEKIAAKVATALSLKGDQRELLLLFVQIKNSKDSREREQLLERIILIRKKYGVTISDDQLELCRDWYHLVVRELLAIPAISQAPADLAAMVKPKLRPSQVEKSVALLIRLGMVAYNIKSGRLEPTDQHVQTDSEAEGMLVVKYHQAMLDVGKNAIDTVNEADRDISANTLRMSAKQIKVLKRMIYDLQMKAMELEPDPAVTSQVYQLNFQFFPVSETIGTAHQEDEECDDTAHKSAS